MGVALSYANNKNFLLSLLLLFALRTKIIGISFRQVYITFAAARLVIRI